MFEFGLRIGKDMKKKQRLKQTAIAIFELVFFILYARLRILNARSVVAPRISFGDTTDYLLIASHSLLSSKFWLADRPFLIPLFFKILGGNPHVIFVVQLYLSTVCWGILAVSCASVIRSYPLRFIVFAAILGFSLSQQIILWDSLLLSESLHFSIAALLYATGFWLLRKWGALQVMLFILLAALLAFTRDANAYMLLMAGVALLILMLFIHDRLRFLLIGIALVAIFLVSYAHSSAGADSYYSLLNIIGLRILPNQTYLAYFEQQGMPVSDALLEHTGTASYGNNLTVLNDPRLNAFRSWIKEHGTITLIKFLWHYKADTVQKPLNDPEDVLAPNLYYYSATGFTPILEKTGLSEILYPMRFGVILFWLANMFAAFISAFSFQQKKALWLFPLLMILLAYPQVVFVWNTDPIEILRHALDLNIQWRLGLWLLIFLLMDYLIEQWTPSIQKSIKHFSRLPVILEKQKPNSKAMTDNFYMFLRTNPKEQQG